MRFLIRGSTAFQPYTTRDAFWDSRENIDALLKIHEALSVTQYLPPRELRELQRSRLKSLFARLPDAQYYAGDPLDTLRQFPIHTHSVSAELRLRNDADHGIMYEYLMDKDGRISSFAFDANELMASLFGYVFRPFPIHAETVRAMMERGFFLGVNVAGSRFLLSESPIHNDFYRHRTKDEALDELSLMAERRKPSILCTYLPLVLEISDGRTFAPGTFAGCITSRETCSSNKIAEIEERLGCPLRRFYLRRDIGFIGWECASTRGTYHLNEERIIAEVLDDAGNPVSSGAYGNIVLTALDYQQIPILRRATGDRGRFLESRCPCGRSLRSLEIPDTDTMIRLAAGDVSLPLIQNSILSEGRIAKLRRCAITQAGDNAIRVTLVPASAFSDVEIMAMRLAIYQVLPDHGIEVEIRFEGAS